MERLKDMVSIGSQDAHSTCHNRKDAAMKHCSIVKQLIDTMNAMGCPVDSSRFFNCFDCDGEINGGFQLDDNGKPSVVLCQNHLKDQESMDRTMAHELIHAYDQCRAKINWKNCEHHACSEVRAAALSGDCNWKYEFGRGYFFQITKQHQVCTRRRAELSLSFNGPCKGKEKECVDKVFDKCYRDTLPFSEIP